VVVVVVVVMMMIYQLIKNKFYDYSVQTHEVIWNSYVNSYVPVVRCCRI